MNNSNVTTFEGQPAALNTSAASLMLDQHHMARLVAMAEIMASGRATLPKHLQGSKGDCMAICMQAAQWGMNPFAVAQKTHVVNGTLGYEAQLVIAVINNSGLLASRIKWEWLGPWERIVGKFKTVESKTKKDDDGHPKKYIVPDWLTEHEVGLSVTASATIKGETQPRTLTLLMSQARTRNSTLWTEDPKQQLAYLAAKRWARLYMPDVLLGVYTPDELELGDAGPRTIDMGRADVVKDSAHDSAPAALTVEQLADWRAAAAKGTAGARAHWLSMGDLRALATPMQKDEIWSSAVRVDEERAAAAAAAKTPAQPAADPSTGEIDDAFVAAMTAAEKEGVA